MSEIKRVNITSQLHERLRQADKNHDGKIEGAQESAALKSNLAQYSGTPQEQIFLSQLDRASHHAIQYTEASVAFVESSPLTLDPALRDIRGDLQLQIEDINGFSDRGRNDLSGKISGTITIDKGVFDRAFQRLSSYKSENVKIKGTGFNSAQKTYTIRVEASKSIAWGLIPTWDNFDVKLRTDAEGRFFLEIGDNWYPDDEIMKQLEQAIKDNLKDINLTTEKQGTRLYILPDIQGFKLPIQEHNQPTIEKIQATTQNTRIQIDSQGNISMRLTQVPVSGSSGQATAQADRAKDTANLGLKFGLRFDNQFNVQGQEYLLDGQVHMDIERGEMPEWGAKDGSAVEQHLGTSGQLDVRDVRGKIAYRAADKSWETQIDRGAVVVHSDSGATASAQIAQVDIQAKGEKKTKIASRNIALSQINVQGKQGHISAAQVTVQGELGKNATVEIEQLDTNARFGDIKMDADKVNATLRQTDAGTTVTIHEGQLQEFKRSGKSKEVTQVRNGTLAGTFTLDKNYALSDLRLNLNHSDIRFGNKDFTIVGKTGQAVLTARDSQNLNLTLDRASVNKLSLKGVIDNAQGVTLQGAELAIKNGQLQELSIRRFDARQLALGFQEHQLDASDIKKGSLTYAQGGKNIQFALQGAQVGHYALTGVAQLQGQVKNISGHIQGENVTLTGDLENVSGHVSPDAESAVDASGLKGHLDYRGDQLRFDVESGRVENVKLSDIQNASADLGQGHVILEGKTVKHIQADRLNNLNATITSDGRTVQVQDGQQGTFQYGDKEPIAFTLGQGKVDVKGQDMAGQVRVRNASGRLAENLTLEADFAEGRGSLSTARGSKAQVDAAAGHVSLTPTDINVTLDAATIEQASHTTRAGAFTVSSGRLKDSSVQLSRQGEIKKLNVQTEDVSASGEMTIGLKANAERVNGQLIFEADKQTIVRATQGDLHVEQGQQQIDLRGITDSELNLQADGTSTFRARVQDVSGTDQKNKLSASGQNVALAGNLEEVDIKAEVTRMGIDNATLTNRDVAGKIRFGDGFNYEGTSRELEVDGPTIKATLHNNTISGDVNAADMHSRSARIETKDGARVIIDSGQLDTRISLGAKIDLHTVSHQGHISAVAAGLREYFPPTSNATMILDLIESQRIEASYQNLEVSGLNPTGEAQESAMPENVSLRLTAPRIDSKVGRFTLDTTIKKQGERFLQSGTIGLAPDQRFFNKVKGYLKEEYGISVDEPMRLQNGKLVIAGSKGIVHDLGVTMTLKGDRMELNVDEARMLLFISVRGKAVNTASEGLNASLVEHDRVGRHKLSISINDMLPGENLQIKAARFTPQGQIEVDFQYIDTPEFNTSEAVRQRFQDRLERTLFKTKDNVEDIAEELSAAKLKEIFQFAHPNQLHRMEHAVGVDADTIVRRTLAGDAKASDLQKYPVENRAIMASYLANSEGFGQKVDDEEEYLLIRLLNSLESGQGDSFVATLHAHELKRIMDNIPDNDDDHSDKTIYGSIEHLYRQTDSPFRRLKILQAIATGMDEGEQVKAFQRLRRLEENPYVFQLAQQQKWFNDVKKDARRYFN